MISLCGALFPRIATRNGCSSTFAGRRLAPLSHFRGAITTFGPPKSAPRPGSHEKAHYSTDEQKGGFDRKKASDARKELDDIYYEQYSQILQNLKDKENRRKVLFERFGGVSWRALIAFLCLAIPSFYYIRSRRLSLESGDNGTRSYGSPRIGGRFSLVDHFGRPITSSHFRAELKKMEEVLHLLDGHEDLVQPVMISVDPWRDSLRRLRVYTGEFHRNLVGLVGTPEQIDRVCKIFRVYASKGPEDGEDDYLVDHSVFMYLMDKDFKFIDYFGIDMEAENIADKIMRHMIENGDASPPTVFQRLMNYFSSVKLWRS